MATMTSLKVLVVDDDPTIRDVLRVMLGFEGCQVVDAPDGESALVIFAATRPDVVILDGWSCLPPALSSRTSAGRWRPVPTPISASRSLLWRFSTWWGSLRMEPP